MGPQHGFGLARRIEQISSQLLAVTHGTLYPVLLKLEQEGAITSDWGTSENNRRARYYRLTGGTFRRREFELDEEFAAHVELLTDENIRRGMTPDEARRAARIDPICALHCE